VDTAWCRDTADHFRVAAGTGRQRRQAGPWRLGLPVRATPSRAIAVGGLPGGVDITFAQQQLCQDCALGVGIRCQLPCMVHRPNAFGIGTIDTGCEMEQDAVGGDRRLPHEVRAKNGDRILSPGGEIAMTAEVSTITPAVLGRRRATRRGRRSRLQGSCGPRSCGRRPKALLQRGFLHLARRSFTAVATA
jgi:hypothetical protein